MGGPGHEETDDDMNGPGHATTGGDLVVAAVIGQERRLLAELGVGAALSAAAGSAAWVLGRRSGREGLAAFGRQSLGWAAVDAVIVVRGRRGLTRPAGDADQARAKGRRMRTLTALNAGLDLGYIAGGAALARGTRRRGDGLAIVVQGLFLLWLDTRHAQRFHALVR
jgi:hypothetical protein